MLPPIYRSTAAAVAFVGLAAGIPTLAQAQDAGRTLADNEALFIDGQALTVTPGRSQDDVRAHIGNQNVHALGVGAIVFRSGDRLYVIDAMPMGAAMAMYEPNERQRSYGGLYDPYPSSDFRNDRQRSYGGLYDPYPSSDFRNDRQRSYGGLYDADYANYRLKKVFSEVWGQTSKN